MQRFSHWEGIMRKLVVIAIATAGTCSSAHADFYFRLADDRYLVLSDGLVWTVIIAGGIAALWHLFSNGSHSVDIPSASPEDYDQHAAEYRAKAALKKQELKDVEDFVRNLPKHGRR